MAVAAGSQNADWSWDEHVLALDLYMTNPVSPPSKTSAEVADLSRLLIAMGRESGSSGANTFRNVNGVYMKMMNFRRHDPSFQAQGKAGLSRGSKGEADVWNHFAGDRAKLRAAAAKIRNGFDHISFGQEVIDTKERFAPSMFDDAMAKFKQLVAENDRGHEFVSFHEGVVAAWEDYKPRLRQHAISILQPEAWLPEQIGTGRILERTIAAVEIQDSRANLTNNLVFWQNRFGHANRDHRSFLEASKSPRLRKECEQLLFDVFRSEDERTFDRLAAFIGHKYPLMAYLYFLKDADRFMPIQPTTFDQALSTLGIDLVTRRECSWNNYRAYNRALQHVRDALAQSAGLENVRLVDAHSFCWMLVKLPAVATAPKPAGRASAGRVVGGREGSIIRMCHSIEDTVRNSNGQTITRTIKNKELRLSRPDLEKYLIELMNLQENRCALTGIRFEYHGHTSNGALLPSADRKDSNGHYERGNLQIVCKFINFWKSDGDNDDFKSLLELVRGGAGDRAELPRSADFSHGRGSINMA